MLVPPMKKEQGKSILYLCNRSKLKEDAEGYQRNANVDNVKIMTYQQAEEIIKRANKHYFGLDVLEYHFFLQLTLFKLSFSFY